MSRHAGHRSRTTAGGLVVLTNPTLGFTAPTNNQTFTLGQVVDANFSCAATDPLDSIDSFFGTDDEGNQIAVGRADRHRRSGYSLARSRLLQRCRRRRRLAVDQLQGRLVHA